MLDPSIGRWTSEDPLGFAAGDTNLYRYVGNGPTDGTDPTGLLPDSSQSQPNEPTFGGPANLEVDVVALMIQGKPKKAYIDPDTGEANQEVIWKPKGVKEGGFVIQHVYWYQSYK